MLLQQGLIAQMEFVCKDGDFLQVEDDEKLKKRKERFGIQTGASSVRAGDVEVNFHLYFLTGNETGCLPSSLTLSCFPLQAKKMKRAERFGKV